MKLRQKCLYCGNTSGKLNSNGGCVSCGAFLSLDIEEDLITPPLILPSGTITRSPDFLWNGITGSCSNIEYERMIRGLVRRSVGLDEND